MKLNYSAQTTNNEKLFKVFKRRLDFIVETRNLRVSSLESGRCVENPLTTELHGVEKELHRVHYIKQCHSVQTLCNSVVINALKKLLGDK